MAHFLAELYTPKQAWLDLPKKEREQFFAAIMSAMPTLSALGIEALSLGEIEHSKLHTSKHTFFAVWRCPDDAALKTLISGIAQTGWHDYFDTINAGGEGTDFTGHLAQLIQAS